MPPQSELATGLRSRASSREPLLEARDLYRIPLWLLAKPFNALAPISWHFRLATLGGTRKSSSSMHRDRLMQTLEQHLGDTASALELRRIARHHFEVRARSRFMQNWPEIRNFAGVESIPIVGLDDLDAALERGKGAILATTHFGHMRMIKPILRSRGRRAFLVAHDARISDRPARTRIGRFVHTTLLHLPQGTRSDQWQETSGNDLLPDINLRRAVAALGRNEVLIILVDGRSAQALHPIPVLGIEVHFASGVMSIARSTGAAVLPAFAVDDPRRPGRKGLRLVIHPPLELQITGDHRADADTNLQRFASVYEEYVRAHPHNFHWSRVRGDALANPQASRVRRASVENAARRMR